MSEPVSGENTECPRCKAPCYKDSWEDCDITNDCCPKCGGKFCVYRYEKIGYDFEIKTYQRKGER